MTEKRFNKVKVYLSYEIFDNKTNEQLDVNKIVDLLNEQHEDILFKIKLMDNLQDAISELKEENKQLKQAIAETEKMVQSTYDELTKLRCIKKNLGRIKTQWDWIMEAIQYD